MGQAAEITVKPWRLALWGGALSLLLLPAVAMQFSDEFGWDGADFIIFGAMLAIACGAFELAVRWTESRARRVLAGIAIAAIFFLVWLELAAGIFPS